MVLEVVNKLVGFLTLYQMKCYNMLFNSGVWSCMVEFVGKLYVIWLATIWSILKRRSRVIFSNLEVHGRSIFEYVKLLSRGCLKYHVKGFSFYFHQWCIHPLSCLLIFVWVLCCSCIGFYMVWYWLFVAHLVQ